MKTAYKYHSLDNDFLIIDGCDDTTILKALTPTTVQHLCHRRRGIGADGVLVITGQSGNTFDVHVFNSDGSDGGRCLNGARCLTCYLATEKGAPSPLSIQMNGTTTRCWHDSENVKLEVASTTEIQRHSINIEGVALSGYALEIGNPHFVIDKPTRPSWLSQHGPTIERSGLFPHGTNIEFFWPGSGSEAYNLLVYERGCAVTPACGTGAAATMMVISQIHGIDAGKHIRLSMPGGDIITYLSCDGNVIQEACALQSFVAKVSL
jgi:diaminopimelate epimerase